MFLRDVHQRPWASVPVKLKGPNGEKGPGVWAKMATDDMDGPGPAASTAADAQTKQTQAAQTTNTHTAVSMLHMAQEAHGEGNMVPKMIRTTLLSFSIGHQGVGYSAPHGSSPAEECKKAQAHTAHSRLKFSHCSSICTCASGDSTKGRLAPASTSSK
jgi:hypothetical protein